MIRAVSILAMVCAVAVPRLHAQPDPVLPKSGATAPVRPADSVRAAPADTLRQGPSAPSRSDSLALASGDTVRAPGDTVARDSGRAERVVFRWEPTSPDGETCRVGMETAMECWRRNRDLANQDIGFPGPRSWTLSLTNWRPLPHESPYFPFWRHSPYLSGGLPPPERFSLTRIGGDLVSAQENWTPVVPLDTPLTRLDWDRGALTLNVFNLKLERMLSDRVYLGLDFYSASADSQTYDYQFNVHQPYLGGWGFLGRIYPPIDRDSASLVLGGLSHEIHVSHVRPRVGVWIDSNRVLEFFLDRTKNTTFLTYPYGLTPRSAGSLIPAGPDSVQTLMPSGMTSLSEGILYGETHRAWTSQFELSHGGLDLTEFRRFGAITSGNEDEIRGDVFRARGSVLASGLFGRPRISAEGRSELWSGEPLLTMAGANPVDGWADAQEADLEFSPSFPFLDFRAGSGIGRSSRMDNQVFWLPRYGASATAKLPFGFGAEASLASRMEDPTWEMLYRTNPARFRFASPGLQPRTDRTYGGAFSWAWSRMFLEAGADRLEVADAWLPRVLPNPGACGALKDTVYAGLAGRSCVDSAGGASGVLLTDTLALGHRNYERETVDALRLGLGFGLGNWTLALRNRFVVARTVDDPDLSATIEDWSIPERVFKGRLNWKRSLLDGRLNLDFGWDWEWFSTRYAWVPDLAGSSKVIKLDEYLALDMDAAMKIKTFTLFFKVRNFNHDRYATEPGVHPPGINFRFGVDWTLFN
jgi:hypothetical protein